MAADDHYLKHELYALIRGDDRVLTFLLDGPVDGLWFWDVDEPEEEWVSAPFWRLLGYDPASKASNAAACHGIIDPNDLAAAMEAFAVHCEDSLTPFDQTLRYRHADGRWIPIRCRGLAIRDDAGKPVRMLGVHARIEAAGMALLNLVENAREAGGDIKARSAPVQQRQHSIPAVPPESEPEALGPSRILVAEDDPLVLKHVSSLVSSLGYTVRTATNAAEALALIEADRQVDLLLTDVMMPGGRNGSELARAAAELVPDLRVMYMSGHVRDVMAPLGDGRKEAVMISKPFRPAELAKRIEQELST